MLFSLTALVGVAALGLLARWPLPWLFLAAPMAAFLARPSLWAAFAVVAGVCLAVLVHPERSL